MQNIQQAEEERVPTESSQRTDQVIGRLRTLIRNFMDLPSVWIAHLIWCVKLPEEMYTISYDASLLQVQSIIRTRQPSLASFNFTLFNEIIEEKQLATVIILLPDLEMIKTYNLLGPNNCNFLNHLQKMRKLRRIHFILSPADSFRRACLNIEVVTIQFPREKTLMQPAFDVVYSLQLCRSLNFIDCYIGRMTMHLIKELPLVEFSLNDSIFEPVVAGELHVRILSNPSLRILGLVCLSNDLSSGPLQNLIFSLQLAMNVSPLELHSYTFTLTPDVLELHSLLNLHNLKKLTVYFSDEINCVNLENLNIVLRELSTVEIILIQFRYKVNLDRRSDGPADIRHYINMYRAIGPNVTVVPLTN